MKNTEATFNEAVMARGFNLKEANHFWDKGYDLSEVMEVAENREKYHADCVYGFRNSLVF